MPTNTFKPTAVGAVHPVSIGASHVWELLGTTVSLIAKPRCDQTTSYLSERPRVHKQRLSGVILPSSGEPGAQRYAGCI
jgi:hypothetical protein